MSIKEALAYIIENDSVIIAALAASIKNNQPIIDAIAFLITYNATIIDALTQTIINNETITASVREAAKGQGSWTIARPKEGEFEPLFKATYPTQIVTEPTTQVLEGSVSNPGYSHAITTVLQPGMIFGITPTGVATGTKRMIVTCGLTLYTDLTS
jgi:hypothetical protein